MPVKPKKSLTRWGIGALVIGILGFLGSQIVLTNTLAYIFRDAPALGYKIFGLFYQPFAGISWLKDLDMRCYIIAHFQNQTPCSSQTLAQLPGLHLSLIYWFVGTCFFMLLCGIMGTTETTSMAGRLIPTPTTGKFKIILGTASGKLAALGHGAAMKPNQQVILSGDDVSQNCVAYGGIGSGKTTRFINPIVKQSLLQDCGMLIFDIKGDYNLTVTQLAKGANREVETIGIGALPCNLLEGLTPEVAASFIQSALLLAGNSGDNAVWNNVATELARNILGILSFVPKHYTLNGLYRYIFQKPYRDDVNVEIQEVTNSLNEQLAFDQSLTDVRARLELLSRYQDYHTLVFETFDERIKSGVQFQISSALSLFSNPEIERTFCNSDTESVKLESILEGKIFLLSLPLQTYGLAAKTVYTIIKLRFFAVMERRRIETTWNQTRSIVFVCDEYQEIISIAKGALSDLTFWDKSRSARCVGVISAQGVESFRAAIGNNSLTDAMLQNFRQVVCFRTEDRATIEHMTFLMGQVEVEKINTSRSAHSALLAGRDPVRGTNTSTQMQALITPQFFRQFQVGEAFALLSIQNEAYDDIIITEPVYGEAKTGAK